MTPPLEATLEGEFREGVQRAGGMAFKLAPTHVGLPDRMVVIRGYILLVELKTETGTLRPSQRELHNKLARHGVHVTVLHGRQAIKDWCAALDLL